MNVIIIVVETIGLIMNKRTSLALDEERLVRWLWPRNWCGIDAAPVAAADADDAVDDDDAVGGRWASASKFGVEPCIRLDRAGYTFQHNIRITYIFNGRETQLLLR